MIDRPGPDLNVYDVDSGGFEWDLIDVLISVDGQTFISIKDTEGPMVRIPGDEAHGNDAFARSYDIGSSGLGLVRFLRIDGDGNGPAGGANDFDLDAVGAIHTRLDCNGNGVPDECDVSGPTLPSGHALEFDGAGAHVLIPSDAELRPANNFTIESWVNLSSLGPVQSIFRHDDNGGGDDSYFLLVAEGGEIRFGGSNANGGVLQSVYSAQALSIGQWHHVAGVYDNSVLKVYVDGRETSKPAAGDVRYQALANVNIGRRGGTALPDTALLHGTLDEVRFWNVPRSQAEIQAAMTMPLTGTEPGLVGYWRLDERGGLIAGDSANDHDGTLINGPSWIEVPTDGSSADCDMNGVPDECELAGNDANSNGVLDGCEQLAGGDFDDNGIVDLRDHEYLIDCHGGPGSPPTPTDANAVELCLQAFDENGDRDIDLGDYAQFQSGFTGQDPP